MADARQWSERQLWSPRRRLIHDAIALLRGIQWIDVDADGFACCPECEGQRPGQLGGAAGTGHIVGCALADIFKRHSEIDRQEVKP